MKVLALVDAPDHVCCRYRIQAFEPALNAAAISLHVEGLARAAMARIGQIRRAARYDVVILQRKLMAGWQFGLLRRSARRLVFDLDDAVLYRDSYDPRGPHCPRRAARFARTVRQVDGVIAGNDFLADLCIRSGARAERVRVIPTCIDVRDYAPRTRPSIAGIQLVWIGSSSTLQGLERRRDLLERIGRAIPGIRLRVICNRFPRFDSIDVLPIPWDEATEAEEIARGDVGISLIPDDVWSRGKCGLKVLQYRAAGLPVIADPVGVHFQMIRDGVDGFLPSSAEAWIEAVRYMVTDRDRRLVMGLAARRSVEAEYSVTAWEGAFVAAVAGAGPPPAPRRFAESRKAGRSTNVTPGNRSGLDLSLATPGERFRRPHSWL